MKQLILFLMDWLREKLDPDYAADLARYRERVRGQQELIDREAQALQADTRKLVQLQCQRDQVGAAIEEIKAEVAELERRRDEVRGEVKQKIDVIRNTPADELRRQPL
ncbi:MAG: hypothetical protein ABIP75_13485 [Pyrinomonadaceae bacterium]